MHYLNTVLRAAIKHSYFYYFIFIAKLEFALTVLKPEPESDPPDQLFLLASAVVQKGDIQVHMLILNMLDGLLHAIFILWVLSNPLWCCHVFKKLILACYLQVDRKPVTVTAVKSVTETANPELPSLSILGYVCCYLLACVSLSAYISLCMSHSFVFLQWDR